MAVIDAARPLVRIHFPLAHQERDHPPAGEETLWAEDLGDGLFRLDNIPFFAKGISLGDVVEASPVAGVLTFERVRGPSGHSTIRVIVYDGDQVAEVRKQLGEMGCASELSHLPRLIAVDIPPAADFAAVRNFLQHGLEDDRWDYEEAAIPDTRGADTPPTRAH